MIDADAHLRRADGMTAVRRFGVKRKAGSAHHVDALAALTRTTSISSTTGEVVVTRRDPREPVCSPQ